MRGGEKGLISMIYLSRYVCCIFFSVFWISFGKTKQIVIALVTTTFKIVLSVAQANVRLSGCEFYAGNIDNLFWDNLAHIFSYQHTKSAPTEASAPKNADSKLSPNELIR
jgi:hypothetical protein